MSKVIIVGAGASIDASEGKLPSATNFFERIRGNSELMSLLESPEIKTALSTLLPISLTDEASYKRLDKLNIEELFTLASLEAEMVGNTLYYVMSWFENPVEARIAFDSSVPHHRVALDVPPDWYRGMIEAFLAVVEPAAIADEADREAWQVLREGLVGLVERNRFL